MSNGDFEDDYDYPVRPGRGGCYLDSGKACRSAIDIDIWPIAKHKSVGFRLVLWFGKKTPAPDEKNHDERETRD